MLTQQLRYPLDFKFNIFTISNDFSVTDALGNPVFYVRSKIFKLKDDVIVYSDASKTKELFRMKANQWIDFNSVFNITCKQNGQLLGRVGRRGFRSIWKASYQIFDPNGQREFHMEETNPLIKVLDGIFGELPIIGGLTGYFFNPNYSIKDKNGIEVFKMRKMPSLFGRRFQVMKTAELQEDQESLLLLSLMMMVLLERKRG